MENWSKADDKLYDRCVKIYQHLHTKNTKELAKKYRKEAHIDRADFILQYNIKNKIKCLDILLNGDIKKKFFSFWRCLIRENLKLSYVLNDQKLRYFIAELFFCDCVTDEILQITNLTGIEWIDYSQHKGDNNIYLKISPGTPKETVKDFILSRRFSMEKAFTERRNLPYIAITFNKKNEKLPTVKNIAKWYYDNFDIKQLQTLAPYFNREEYNLKIKSLSADEKLLTKLWHITFILVHSGLKKRCSVRTVEGYVFGKS